MNQIEPPIPPGPRGAAAPRRDALVLSFRVQEFSRTPVRLGCPRQNLTRRISWLGERDRLGRRGRRLADRIPPLLYNFYRGPQVQNEFFARRLFPKNLIWASSILVMADPLGEPERDFPETIHALNP